MSTEIGLERVGSVAVVRLLRPQARNAISREMHRELDRHLAMLDADADVAAIVITGADPAFSAGVDIRELEAHPEVAHDIGPRRTPLISVSKPVIGAINGPAYTGGLELALNCDWLIASERARFADTHTRLGLTPGWGLIVLLSEAVGSRRARQLVTTCEPIDASTALSWGLVNEVVPHERLVERATAVAALVADNDGLAIRTVLATFAEERAHTDGALWEIEARNWIDPSTTGTETTRG